jgi:hypothetical protein
MKDSDFFKASGAKHAEARDAADELHAHYVSEGNKSGAGNEGAAHRKVASHFKKLSKAHGDLADLHAQQSEDCEKAERDHLNKIRPDSITSVPFSDAPDSAFGIRAIPRPGQPDLNAGARIDKAAVPAQFRHLLLAEDEL